MQMQIEIYTHAFASVSALTQSTNNERKKIFIQINAYSIVYHESVFIKCIERNKKDETNRMCNVFFSDCYFIIDAVLEERSC